jgi:predicted phosphodiesterase
MVRLIHLSDIHFRKGIAGGPFDLDAVLRAELERDLRTQLGSSSADGILITGDVAFAGKRAEYVSARDWIEKLCELARCTTSDVYVVPGNHDVDREIVDGSDAIKSIHEKLRSLTGVERDRELARLLSDEITAAGLLAPLAEYNDFALRYNCAMSPDRLYWEDDIRLDDGSTLRIRGLCSVLVSDKLDDQATNKLILGSHQVVLRREDGVEYLTLCHHPQDWLHDAEAVEDGLLHARVRLFGHKHRQRVHRLDDSVVITAGATHPDRAEKQWQPRYNIIDIDIRRDGDGARWFVVRVYSRVWDDAYQVFKADSVPEGGESRQYDFSVDPWEEPVAKASEPKIDVREPIRANEAEETPVKEQVAKPERALLYRFLSLPFQRQVRIALELKFIDETEIFSREAELWRAVFTRARDSGRLDQFWNAVESQIGDRRYDSYENPFEHKE